MAGAWAVSDEDLVRAATGFALQLSEPAVEDLEGHLYVNDYTPVPGDTVLNYDEVTGSWYTPFLATTDEFGPGPIVEHVVPVLNEAGAGIWNVSGLLAPLTIYGYYVTDADGGWRWAERFAEPLVLINGTHLELTLRILFERCVSDGED